MIRSILTHMYRVLGYRRKIFRLCQTYVDWYRNEEDRNPRANGEDFLVQSLLPNAKVVFDVGANRGDWAAAVAAVNSSALVHCFEPGETAFAKLSSRELPRHFVLNNFAASDKPGIARLNTEGSDDVFSFYDGNTIGFHLARLGPVDGSNIVVKTDTIDRYCTAHGIREIDYLKIDVEGHERVVLEGCREMMRERRIRMIQFEHGEWAVASQTLVKDHFEYFRDFGYDLYKVFPRGLAPVTRYSHLLESFRYGNWFASLGPVPEAVTLQPFTGA